jgi:hypothetical protein
VRSRIGAAQHRDLVAQNEELDVLGGGRANRQQDQPEHLPEDQQQPQRHIGIMPTRRSPLVSDPSPSSGTPLGSGGSAAWDDATHRGCPGPTIVSGLLTPGDHRVHPRSGGTTKPRDTQTKNRSAR